MKMYKSIEKLGIETFEELQEFQNLLVEQVTLGMVEEKSIIDLKWKDIELSIKLDSDNFLLGFTYGTAIAFMELKSNLTTNYTDTEND